MTGISHQQAEQASLEVLIPYYGDPDLMRTAVGSVLAQTDPHWVLRVVEDGAGPADVEEWLLGLGDARVRYHRNNRNLGVAGNFQRCLDLAEAEHVCFLGCDDLLGPRYVEVMRRAVLAEPGAAIFQPGVAVIDAQGAPVGALTDWIKARLRNRAVRRNGLVGDRLLASLLRGNWTYFPSLVWRRSALATVGFRQDLRVTPDLWALARLVLDGHRLVVLDDLIFEYRRHRASVSSLDAASSDRFDEERDVILELGRLASERSWARAARAARVRPFSRLHAGTLLPQALRRGDVGASRTLLRHLLLHWGAGTTPSTARPSADTRRTI